MKHELWDPSLPRFLSAVGWTLAGGWGLVSLGSLLLVRPAFWGVWSGGALAVALYLVALAAGRRAMRTRQWERALLVLLAQQALLWIGTAVLLAVVRVHPVGFVLGVGVLPAAIVLTLLWFVLQGRKSRS